MAFFRFLYASFGVAAASSGFLKAEAILPGVTEVMSKPTDVLKALTEKVTALQTHITQVQEENTAAIKGDKAKYEAELEAQQHEIQNIERQNQEIDAEIHSLEQTNKNLRVEAEKLRAESATLTEDLKRIQKNISTAQEFTDTVLNESEHMIYTAPAIHVLQELNDKDEMARQAEAHQSHLSEVGNSQPLSFLQLGARSKKNDDTAGGLLESMGRILEDLQQELNESRASLKAEFNKSFQAGDERRAALLSEQAQRNQTRTAAMELWNRLTSAVKHLAGTRNMLIERKTAAKHFASQLGMRPLPRQGQSMALLQIGEGPSKKKHNKTKALPEVTEVLSTPKHIFEALTSNVNSLEARLVEVEQQGTSAISEQKAEYENMLEQQSQNITALAQKNKNTIARIDAMKKSSDELRSKAQTLKKQGANLAADLQALQKNISIAHEFIANALTTSADIDAPELQVLTELAQQDAEAGLKREHQSQLNQIRMAMMQTDATASDIDAQGIIERLNSALSDLTKEQHESVLLLKNAFEKQYQAGEEHRKKLVAEEADLNAAETYTSELHEKLIAAVKHLEQTNESLVQQRDHLRQYVQRLVAPARSEQQ